MASRSTEWRRKNPEKARAGERSWAARNPDKHRAGNKRRRLKHRYGLTVEAFERMLERQRGLCALCAGPPGKQGLHVDHDHETGRVRGLLCFECNSGLGKFRDSVGLLFRAVSYLVER